MLVPRQQAKGPYLTSTVRADKLSSDGGLAERRAAWMIPSFPVAAYSLRAAITELASTAVPKLRTSSSIWNRGL